MTLKMLSLLGAVGALACAPANDNDYPALEREITASEGPDPDDEDEGDIQDADDIQDEGDVSDLVDDDLLYSQREIVMARAVQQSRALGGEESPAEVYTILCRAIQSGEIDPPPPDADAAVLGYPVDVLEEASDLLA